MDPRNLGERLEATDALDRLAHPFHRTVTALLPRGPVKDTLHGVWLGHPLHPLLTDLTIGFWTSAFVLDLVAGRRARPAANALVGIGVATALPTAAACLADDHRTARSSASCSAPSGRSRAWRSGRACQRLPAPPMLRGPSAVWRRLS